ncbi:MAG: 30S ribosomal protein S1 [Deltaproteobacteria bacterium]|nr:30S ribosomal protein S1 [Deltaproteobacteria bacterium]
MNDEPINDEQEPSFADLLESYSEGMQDDLQVGDKITGKIISIGKDTIFIDTGTKVDGAAEKKELLDENDAFPYEVGDPLELYVVSISEDEIRLSRALSGIGGYHMLKDAHDGAVPVEGKVTAPCKGGFHVEILKRRAFCPISQIDVKFVEDPEPYVGNTYSFLITRLEENAKNIVVSRRALLAEAQEKERQAFYETLHTGDIYEGTVTKIMPYGAFVELTPGVEGMVHISEVRWSRVENLQDVLAVNDVVRVRVIGIKEGKKAGIKKLELSIKQVQGDPWDAVEDTYHEGDIVQGTVSRCMKFGAFVELEPGVEGLVHISEMSYTQRVHKPEDVVRAGETVSVLIKGIDLENRRISLSIKEIEGDPWSSVGDDFRVGQKIEGTLEKKESFGCFIRLKPGITGLLPKSKLAASGMEGGIEKLKEGQRLSVVIASINPMERKISLTPGDGPAEENWQQFNDDEAPALGDLAEKLKQALKNK